MSATLAKNAKLTGFDSHWIADEHRGANGVSKEEVFPRFSATWRGREVHGTISVDRYSAGMDANSQRLIDWRIYVREAWELDEDKNGGRGAELSSTAARALRELLEPLVREWLESDEYRASFERACAQTVLRHFSQDRYNTAERVAESLATFKDRIAPATVKAIEAAIEAYRAYDAALTQASEVATA